MRLCFTVGICDHSTTSGFFGLLLYFFVTVLMSSTSIGAAGESSKWNYTIYLLCILTHNPAHIYFTFSSLKKYNQVFPIVKYQKMLQIKTRQIRQIRIFTLYVHVYYDMTHPGRRSGTCQLSPSSLVFAAGLLSGFKLSSLGLSLKLPARQNIGKYHS